MAMWTHFCKLIWRSIVYLPKTISGNWLSLLWPIGIFLAVEKFGRKKAWRDMRWHNNKNDTLVLVGAYFLLFGWAVVHTVYQDHEDLVAQAANATAQLKKLTTPQLNGSIGTLLGAPFKGETMITLEVTIKNTGTPSIAENFAVTAHFPNGKMEKGKFYPLPPEGGFYTLGMDGKEPPRRVYEDQFLEKKSIDHPIVEGGAASGIIMREFHTKRSDFLPGTIIELTFFDVNGKLHSATYPLTEWQNNFGQ